MVVLFERRRVAAICKIDNAKYANRGLNPIAIPPNNIIKRVQEVWLLSMGRKLVSRSMFFSFTINIS